MVEEAFFFNEIKLKNKKKKREYSFNRKKKEGQPKPNIYDTVHPPDRQGFPNKIIPIYQSICTQNNSQSKFGVGADETVELAEAVVAAEVAVEAAVGENSESNASHFVVTTTDGGARFFPCGCCFCGCRSGICSLAALGIAFLILSMSRLSTYFCILLSCNPSRAMNTLSNFA